MSKLIGFVKREPVRVQNIVMALFSVAGFYIHSGAWPLLVGVFIAATGQGVRSMVSPVMPTPSGD